MTPEFSPPPPRGRLAERYTMPPFSVLYAREGTP